LAFKSGRQNAKKRYILYYDEKPTQRGKVVAKPYLKGYAYPFSYDVTPAIL